MNIAPKKVKSVSSLDSLRALRDLVSPYGLVSRIRELPPVEGEPNFNVHLSHLDSVARILSDRTLLGREDDIGNSDGAGTGLDAERAQLVSIAEALERYSVAAWGDEDFITASESELSAEFVSPMRWPRCSAQELSSKTSQLRRYDPTVPIRWVRAWSLTRKAEVLVPAIAVYLHMPYISDSERFIRGITTGAAVHSTLEKATLSGLLEVIERDAVSLVWLQRLQLPGVEFDIQDLSEEVSLHHSIAEASNLQMRLFDATTDFGVPVLYALQLSESDPVLSQVVGATCALSPEEALAKLYRELSSIRIALRGYINSYEGRVPDPSKVSVVGGAVHNATRTRRDVFKFLLENHKSSKNLLGMPDLSQEKDPLTKIVNLLAGKGAEVLVVDITTDEARQVGMKVVKVLVPEAMPVSFVHNERFLATPRLYTAPACMGYPVHSEQDINPEHQPFA